MSEDHFDTFHLHHLLVLRIEGSRLHFKQLETFLQMVSLFYQNDFNPNIPHTCHPSRTFLSSLKGRT